MGSLISNDNETPKFAQLYVFNTANELNNRIGYLRQSKNARPVD